MKKSTWQLGHVKWFDELSGDGLIQGADGRSYYVHHSAIDSSKKWKTLKRNKKVKFQLHIDPLFTQVEKLKEI